MYIENVNEKIRNFYAQKYSSVFEETVNFIDDFLDKIKLIKEKNWQFYKRTLEAFYPIFYISNLEQIGELESLKKIEPDYDAEDEFVYDVEYLKSITTLDMLIEEIETSPEILIDMLISNLSFQKRSELEKRGLLVEYKVCDEYLKLISTTWILDRIDYCRKYTKEEFYNRCLEIERATSNPESVDSNIINNSIEFLKNLAIFDCETFENLFFLILEDSYIYLKYQRSLDIENLFLTQKLYKIESIYEKYEENIIYDDIFIGSIILDFFAYNKLPSLEKQNLKHKFENNKILAKRKAQQ